MSERHSDSGTLRKWYPTRFSAVTQQAYREKVGQLSAYRGISVIDLLLDRTESNLFLLTRHLLNFDAKLASRCFSWADETPSGVPTNRTLAICRISHTSGIVDLLHVPHHP